LRDRIRRDDGNAFEAERSTPSWLVRDCTRVHPLRALREPAWIVAPLFTPDLGPGDTRMLLPIVIDGVQYDYEFTFALQAAPTRRGR